MIRGEVVITLPNPPRGDVSVDLLQRILRRAGVTKTFALRVICFVSTCSKSKVADVLSDQLLRSATSSGASYREANRALSRNDFTHKIALVEKEAAETQYWFELSEESALGIETDQRWLL